MEKTIEIPEGYEARIEGNKVILERKESEDEKIMKWLIKFVEVRLPDAAEFEPEYRAALAWLERQKEQQPSTAEDIAVAYQMRLAEGRKEQKPAEWSEEDEAILGLIQEAVDKYDFDNIQTYYAVSDKLKSLRPQPHWKPSEDQMDNLLAAIECLGTQEEDVSILNSLYKELKKL